MPSPCPAGLSVAVPIPTSDLGQNLGMGQNLWMGAKSMAISETYPLKMVI